MLFSEEKGVTRMATPPYDASLLGDASMPFAAACALRTIGFSSPHALRIPQSKQEF